MGSRNSKISPQSASLSEKGVSDLGTEEKNDGTLPGVTHKPSLSSDSNASTAGPSLDMVTPKKKASPTSVTYAQNMPDSSSASSKRGKFSVGDKVLGNFEGHGEWFPGVIIQAYDDLVYDIEYDDGDTEDSVPASDIKARPRGTLGPLATPAVSSNTPSGARETSGVISVESSSKLLPDDDDDEAASAPAGAGGASHTLSRPSSKLQRSQNGRSHVVVKASTARSENLSRTNEIGDDYGEYDGSLDFVPRSVSKLRISLNANTSDDDDEFAELDAAEKQKCLTSSLLSGEREGSSAVIKNLYREDSKNNLLSPQLGGDKKARRTASAASSTSPGPSLVHIERPSSLISRMDPVSTATAGKEELERSGNKKREATDQRSDAMERQLQLQHEDSEAHDEKTKQHQQDQKQVEHEQKQEPEQQAQQQQGQPQGQLQAMRQEQQQAMAEQVYQPQEQTEQNVQHTTAPGAPEKGAERQTEPMRETHSDVWRDDDDVFGLHGMSIQRVDSVESVEEYCVEPLQMGTGHYDEHDQSHHYGLESGTSHDDSFFYPHAAEQSHADSFYSPSHHQSLHHDQSQQHLQRHESCPDWGHISEQSAHLYDYADDVGEVHEEQEYQQGAPTDSGWSLCHTADGTPYFYSYELQESCWELPTTKSPPPLQPQPQQLFQPAAAASSSPSLRPHTSSTGNSRHVSRGVVQSKHELAKALNSNKSKSTLHLTNLMEDDDDAPYDLGLGSMGGPLMQPLGLKSAASTSRLKDLPLGEAGGESKPSSKGKGLKRPQSMAAMRRKKV